MSKIEGLRGGSLPEAPSTPGIIRYLAFEGDDYLVVRSKAALGAVTAWHHHGDYDVYGYILSGSEQFEFGTQGKEAVIVYQGDFFHIPRIPSIEILTPHSTKSRKHFFSSMGPVQWWSM